ncbi:2-succinylbenzoate--CoA ligase [Streptomyces violaceorubidus]
MGLMGLMTTPLMTGSATVLMSPSTFLKRPHLWLHTIDRLDINFSAAPDFAYDVCSRRVTDAQAEGLDLSRWRHAVDGSEPVRSAVLDRFHRRFAEYGLRPETLAPSYGMAEATLFVSGAIGIAPSSVRVDAGSLERDEIRPTAEESGRDVVSCGPPLGAEVLVVDPDTLRTLPEGSVGELWLRGPVVGHGYWGREATNEAEFRATTAEGDSGYLRTGDLGALYGGDLYVTGRIKDVLNLRGRNLYPQDIEHELRVQRPELGNLVGACFAVPQTAGPGQDDVLVVTHEVRGIKDEERLRELAADMRLTVAREFGAPVGAVLLLRPGGVRRTTSGKVQRSAMRELFRAGALEPRHTRTTSPRCCPRPRAASRPRHDDHARRARGRPRAELPRLLGELTAPGEPFSGERLAALDEREAFPADACRTLDSFGLSRYYMPTEHGGALDDFSVVTRLLRAVSRVDLAVARRTARRTSGPSPPGSPAIRSGRRASAAGSARARSSPAR